MMLNDRISFFAKTPSLSSLCFQQLRIAQQRRNSQVQLLLLGNLESLFTQLAELFRRSFQATPAREAFSSNLELSLSTVPRKAEPAVRKVATRVTVNNLSHHRQKLPGAKRFILASPSLKLSVSLCTIVSNQHHPSSLHITARPCQ